VVGDRLLGILGVHLASLNLAFPLHDGGGVVCCW